MLSVLRFRSTAPRARTETGSRDRWRLWLLVLALGLVLVVMRQLGQPGTVRKIERLFGSPRQEVDVPSLDPEAVVMGENRTDSNGDSSRSPETGSLASPETLGDLSVVQDNTFFLSEEREAWFSLFEKLQQSDAAQLSSEAVGEVSYAQLLQQPTVYRGRVVTIRGKVLREEPQQPAENHLGIESYHRLWLAPQGGGQWPFVVYCLNLPTGFPRGENLGAAVSVTGYFFKNWSYPYDDGMGLAPVVLASNFEWQKPAAGLVAEQVSSRQWFVGILLACFVAALVTWQVVRQTRRPQRMSLSEQRVQDELQQLAGEGSET